MHCVEHTKTVTNGHCLRDQRPIEASPLNMDSEHIEAVDMNNERIDHKYDAQSETKLD